MTTVEATALHTAESLNEDRLQVARSYHDNSRVVVSEVKSPILNMGCSTIVVVQSGVPAAIHMSSIRYTCACCGIHRPRVHRT